MFCLMSICISVFKYASKYFWKPSENYNHQPNLPLIFRRLPLPGDAVHFQALYREQPAATIYAQYTRSHPLLVVFLDLCRRHPCTCHHRHADSTHHDNPMHSGELTTATGVLHQSNWCMDVHLSRISFCIVIGVCGHPCVLGREDTSKPTARFQKASKSTRRKHCPRAGKDMGFTLNTRCMSMVLRVLQCTC